MPKTASSNSSVVDIWMSAPRCAVARLEAVPRKNASKMSPKPPKFSWPEKPWPLPLTPAMPKRS